jgi:protein-L-isoaspartate(D-aspartate) O-methyltransferase
MQDYHLARRAMVESQLRPQAVTDAAVLAAMDTVPREDFVPAEARAFAYFDRSIPLADGGAMMPPAALGRLLSEASPQAGEAALVIGPATGYAAALLSAIGLDVKQAAPGEVPSGKFDLILIEGAIEEFPDSLAAKLAAGGRVATALVDRGVTRLAIGTSVGGAISLRTVADADVAPLAAYQRPRSFTF